MEMLLCLLGLASTERGAVGAAERSGHCFILDGKLDISERVFHFCISPRTVLREEFASACVGDMLPEPMLLLFQNFVQAEEG